MKWNYIDTDGNPKKMGVYWVTLIYPEIRGGERTGRTLAEVSTRYFDRAEIVGNWKMGDQPDHGLIWSEETGSSEDERVWAWAEMEEIPFPKRLPKGVTKSLGWVKDGEALEEE